MADSLVHCARHAAHTAARVTSHAALKTARVTSGAVRSGLDAATRTRRAGLAAAVRTRRDVVHWTRAAWVRMAARVRDALEDPRTSAFARRLQNDAHVAWLFTLRASRASARSARAALHAAYETAMAAMVGPNAAKPRRRGSQRGGGGSRATGSSGAGGAGRGAGAGSSKAVPTEAGRTARAQRAEIGRILALDEDDLYSMLRVDSGCTEAHIKHAFRRLARLLHPDKCRDGCDAAQAHAAFLRLQHAYSMLANKRSRAEHDQQRLAQHVGDLFARPRGRRRWQY